MERKELRLMLARASKRFWDAAALELWAEMADLHLDVTERAEVPAR
jgi:hypothetical protein